ncbi:MAG: gliding motility-associated C-terminal domain-containing protein [Saprospiraceae bacterium]
MIGGLPDATYEWTGPAGWTSSDPAPVLDPLSGNYTVVCTSATGCTSTADIDITFGNTPEIEASNDGPLCGEGDLQLTLTGASAGDVILWTAPNGETFDVQNPMLISPGEEYTGTWTVTVDNGICDATTTTEVIVGDLPNVTVNSDCNGSICLGETCTIIGQEVAGTTVTYNWSSNPEGCIPEGITSSTFDLTPTEAGECTIYYSISAGNCTSAVDSITISVSGAPVAIDDEYTIAPDETLVNVSVIENDEFNTDLEFDITLITPTENIPGRLGIDENGILNYDPEGFAGVASFVYELCVNCDTENCVTGIVNITVRDESCRVPTVITPNGDDKNEVLIINCLETEDFPESEMIIFNEWGDEVFYAQPYLNNWDGTLDGESGKDLPDGTYFYIFKLDNATDADKGHITIFR